MATWKKELRKMLKPDTELIFIDPVTSAHVKVFLGPKELKNGAHDLNFVDNDEFYHFMFVSNPDGVEGVQTLLIENEVIGVINIWRVSKFILKGRPPSRSQNDTVFNINPNPVLQSFKADFNQLKMNSVDFIRAYASVYSFLYKTNAKFYVPMACLCQCSGAGKSKSATTTLKETPGFYVCIRDPGSDSLAVPKANTITNALLEIFEDKKYIADSFVNQSDMLCNNSTVGKCLMFVAKSIKSYIVSIAKNLAIKLKEMVEDEVNETTLNLKLLSSIKEFSSNHFEASDAQFESFTSDSIQKDFLNASDDESSGAAKVSHVVTYIHKILQDSVNCFKFDGDEKKPLELDYHLTFACKVISSKINSENPFLFFIDEAGLLSKKNDYVINAFASIPQGKFSAFQIFRRALSYLDINTNIFFFALGTKSTIEELSPPIIDNSIRGLARKDFFPPIVVTQDFDIWREKYPLNEMVPCYKTLLNCCTFKFLATLGHPLFSSLNFDDIVNLAVDKLYNGSKEVEKTYLLATWMIRGGLACDPKSVLAESLVENHMATLFNIHPHSNSSTSSQQFSCTTPTFAAAGSARYDITYQSTPCLALGAREASLRLRFDKKAEFFKQLDYKIESMVVDRGKLGEATGGLLTALLIDSLPNYAQTTLSLELIEEMKALTPEAFHSLWDAKGSLLCPNSGPLKTDFNAYKVVKVESFLKTLMGDDNFERVRHTFPSTTLNGLINASHFVSISRIGESLEVEGQSFANANDFVSDKHRNVITMDRLRLALARQCGLIMPPNYYGIDAIIPVCLATEEVIDPYGNVAIKKVNREDKANDIPYDLYDKKKHSGKNRYRPIYSFLAIQYKSGRFELDAIPKMQARLHIVPCANFSEKDAKGHHLKCPNCVSDLVLKEIFENQISLLYCFLSKEDSNTFLRKQLTVNYGPKFFNSKSSSVKIVKADFLKTLYPNIDENGLSNSEILNAELVESTEIRTFEDFLLRHRIKVNESIEMINIYSDENQGCTYRASDLKKWESDEQKRLHPESKVEKSNKLVPEKRKNLDSEERSTDPKTPRLNYSEALATNFDALTITNENDANNSITSAVSSTSTSAVPSTSAINADAASFSVSCNQTKFPDPIRPSAPYDKSRMSTVVINGWKPWEKVIGLEGTIMADKLFSEFVQDPLKNFEEKDLKLLLPSLKIIMSSKLLGLDRYLEPENSQDDISYNDWLYFLFEKFRMLSSPDNNKIYCSARKALKK